MYDALSVPFAHKVSIPQRPTYLVSRARLTVALAAITEQRLITVTAPAGYGKTALLTDFAANALALPVCWYTLDRYDTDPWTFLSYLAAAIQQQFPWAMAATRSVLNSTGHPSFAAASTMFLREIDQIGDDWVLIIDDWHLVDAVSDIGELVARMLSQCPRCHVILASRVFPSLPDLMLLAARRQMIGLDEEPLRFTASEVTAVLDAGYQAAISEDAAQQLCAKSGGWITAILLVFQAQPPGTEQLPADIERAVGVHTERQLYRFFYEQVIARQPPAMQQFLFETALLEDVSADACQRLLGRIDGAHWIAMVLRDHLFATEIKPLVARYHPLFREFLQHQYRSSAPEAHRATLLQLARAYAQEQQWPRAFDIAIAANDIDGALAIVEQGGEQMYSGGRLETLEHWFAALPLDRLPTPLIVLKARLLIDRNRHQEADVLADLATSRMQAHDQSLVLLLRAQLMRIGGKFPEAIQFASKVLAADPAPPQRAAALRTMAICQHRMGASAAAIEHLQEALAIERQRGDLFATAQLQHDLGICLSDSGNLQAAQAAYRQADAGWATLGNSGLRAASLNSLGLVLHQSGIYAEAHATFQQAIQLAQDAATPAYHALALASLGDVYSDLGMFERAADVYQSAQMLGGSAFLMSYLEVAHARLLLRRQLDGDAQRALQQCSLTAELLHATSIRLLRAQLAMRHQHPAEAMQYLRSITAPGSTASTEERARAWLLQAMTTEQSGEPAARVLEALDQAAREADHLGNASFLVAETRHERQFLYRAASHGWQRATDWLHRHASIDQARSTLQHDTLLPTLQITMLGTDTIMIDAQTVDIGWLKAREVLYFLIEHPSGVSVDALRDAIWPDLAERSRGTLKTAVYQLRSVLPAHSIELRNRQVYFINRAVISVEYDVQLLLAGLTSSNEETVFEAIDSYHGPFLPWSESEWSTARRVYIEQRYLEAARKLAQQYEQQRRFVDALVLYRRILAVDSLDEQAHVGVMRCYSATGNRAAAIAQYQTLRRMLDDELGLSVTHDSEAEQLYVQLLG